MQKLSETRMVVGVVIPAWRNFAPRRSFLYLLPPPPLVPLVFQMCLFRRAGGIRAVLPLPKPLCEAAGGLLPLRGRPFGPAVLLHYHPQQHGHGLSHLHHPAHPHLPVGHAVHPTAQQVLLDDGHRLHGGGTLLQLGVEEVFKANFDEEKWFSTAFPSLANCR